MSSEALSLSRSAEHLLDAEEIQSLLEKGLVTRPSVKAHLEALAKKIHRDASALKRMEDSQKKLEENKKEASKEDQDRSDDNDGGDGSKPQVEEIPSPAQTPAVAVPASASHAVPFADNLKYKPIHKFAFDSGSYNSPTVTIYISIPNIGSIPDPSSQITCKFTSTSFDLTIHDFEEKKANANENENESGTNKNVVNYRLVKNNLANEINPDKSKYILKANKIVIKLAKTKTEYGSYDSWNELTSSKLTKKGSGLSSSSSKKDPTAGIMDLMKDMYDKGDDKMKKMIGETMLKQREGRLDGPGGVGGGMDGMDDLGM
eukprot:266201_1